MLGGRLAGQGRGAAHVCLQGGERTNVPEGPGPACRCRGPWTGCAGSRGDSAGLFSSESDVPRRERLSFSEMGAPETTRQSQPAGVII